MVVSSNTSDTKYVCFRFSIFFTRIVQNRNKSLYPLILSFYNNMMLHNVFLDIVSYGIIINTCVLMNHVNVAFGIFGSIVKCKPNVVTCTTLIDSYYRSSKWNQWHQVLKEMIDKGISPNEVTYNTADAWSNSWCTQ